MPWSNGDHGRRSPEMRVHAFASKRQFFDHIEPIWDRLPESLRGWKNLDESRHALPPRSDDDDIVLVAGNSDFFIKRRLIYVEHGAGQRYVEYRNPLAEASYHGSQLPDNVIACIAPRQDVADAWGVPAFAAGAPICDGYPLFGEPGVIAITFHWNASQVCPEATNALDHYYTDLGRLIVGWRKQGLEVLGHYHPRFPQVVDRWNGWRVPVVTADEVRTRADVLIADNTSLAYEMAYLGRKVVSLNAPWFRRDVEHGLRFWSHAPGIQVDSATELGDLNLMLLNGAWKAETTEYVYGKAMNTGTDGLSAAAWITQLVYGLKGG